MPRHTTLKALAAGALAALALAQPAAARRTIYVPNNADSTERLFKPARFTPTGDGSLYLTRVRWTSYGGAVASASAVSHSNFCDPSCASGRYHASRVHIWLSRPKALCGATVYTMIRQRYSGRVPRHAGKRVSSWYMAGPCADGTTATPRLLEDTFPGSPGSRLYRPRSFLASGHHAVRHARWSRWSATGATARAVVWSQFAAAKTTHVRATVKLTTPRRFCGAYTFTKVLANGRLIAQLVDEGGGTCIWIVQ